MAYFNTQCFHRHLHERKKKEFEEFSETNTEIQDNTDGNDVELNVSDSDNDGLYNIFFFIFNESLIKSSIISSGCE